MDKKKQKREQMDDAIENATRVAELKQLQLELARVKAEHEEIRNQLKRAVADYQNLEKRVAEGRSELTKWGTAELLVKLLPVLDHLEQALEGVIKSEEQERQNGWLKGVEMAVRQFKDVLKSEGLEELPAEGQFDPNLHEALDTEEGENNRILKVLRRGYKLNGKVLRPAHVIVGKEDLSGGGIQSDINLPPEEGEEDK